ncbi:MAG: hypothetical protein QXV32_03580 [Conexivisphaerales archaeon]
MIKRALADIVHILFLYFLLGLLLTGISLLFSSAEVRIGTFRPISQIPLHEFVLLAASMLVSGLALLANRRFDYSLLLLPPVFVIFLDIDHLPSAIGLAQPIRPAHSILFVFLFSILLYYLLHKPASYSLLAVSSFAVHISVDTGVFALLAPFSFNYYSLAGYRPELLLLGIFFAILAGYVHRKTATEQVTQVYSKGSTSSEPISYLKPSADNTDIITLQVSETC